jgi:1-acyl-sn-glycerol-3-phosphate acyltransferase
MSHAGEAEAQIHPAEAGTAPARMRIHYRISRSIAQTLYTLLFWGRVYGVEQVPRTGGVLLACNHQSFFDPALATLALPRECHYMARDSLFRNPLFGRFIESYNAFPVKRAASDIAAMKATLARLKAGALVTAFPEATRTRDGRVNPCRPGVIVLANRAHVPLVPVAIEGAFDAWPRHRKLPRRARIWVEYGRPFSPRELAEAPREELAARLTMSIRTIHNRLRRRAGRTPFVYADGPASADSTRVHGPR